ncbi:unnamed protein product [Lactuca virosa]|uniref:Uncharacterized protein n=1 Tax=Lactuca virosa TaxID=75947 RepID=A0AAU9LP37_9ASTR|nr:unnamed protein product [Lactuca virosa]
MGGGDDDSGEAPAPAPSPSPATFLESDIAVGMNMQHAVSSFNLRNKITNFMPPSSYYHHNQLHNHQASTEIGGGRSLRVRQWWSNGSFRESTFHCDSVARA